MAGFNKVILVGNLTRDPQLKYLPSQTAVTEFGIAMNRKWRDQQGADREEVCFVDCSAFGKTGELVNEYFRKGSSILIEGRLKFDSWDDKQGGGKRSKLSVVVEHFTFTGNKSDGQGGGGGDGGYGDDGAGNDTRNPRPQQRRADENRHRTAERYGGGPPPSPFPEGQEFKDDDIPF